MNLIKLSTNFYPYTLAELQRDNPNVSFPSRLEGVDLAKFDAAEVITDRQPDYDPAVEVIDTLPPKKMKGVWRVQWEKRKLSPAEIRARTPADWDGFNAYMLSDPTFKGYRDTVRNADGDLNGALFDAYGMVATNGVSAFSLVWGLWCQVSGISEVDRGIIVDVARSYNLPGDFISIIEV